MVKKTDWKTEDMPQECEEFYMDCTLSGEDIELIKEGHLPREMEDKWFVYYEDDRLYIHRSWTGYCIYIVDMSEPGRLKVTVNRNKEQYTQTSIESDKDMVNMRINSLLNRRSQNTELMKNNPNSPKFYFRE